MRVDRRQRGLALVFVLWGLALLALMATAFLSETRTETLATRYRADAAEAEALADAGVEWAIWRLTEDVLATRRGDGTASPLPRAGQPVTWQFGNETVNIAIQDETGKLDLNASDPETLASLLRVLGIDPPQAATLGQRIADFRDPDDLRRANGAEAYENLGMPYSPKNAPFERLSELQQVPGITPEILAVMRPHVTVATGRSGVAVEVATPAVLQALTGLDPRTVADYVARRGAADTLPLELPPVFSTVSSGTEFTIRAHATTRDGAAFIRRTRVSLPLLAADRLYHIRTWTQGEANGSSRERGTARSRSGEGLSR